jgi:putative Ca2+/H+ antiporter (TMEM165/GDT1 family)
VNFAIAAAVFPLVFLGELPDKTMFASLVLASRGRPLAVWTGAAAAFLAHVVIAVTIGVAVFHLFPHRAVEGIVAVLFFAGAVYAWRVRERPDEERQVAEALSRRRTVATAAAVIFVAEWGDLTQILTANLAARYHSPLSVGVGAVLALWAVAALAVVAGQGLLRFFSIKSARTLTAVVLLVLAAVAGAGAVRG